MIIAVRRTWRTLAAALLLADAGAAPPPQTVYRCGPEGRVYSQTPCADGRPVTVDDPRSASQQQSAKDLAARESKSAQQLADERRQREAAAKGQPAIGIKPEPAADAASAPRKAKAKAASVPQAYVGPPTRPPTGNAASR